MEPMDGVKSEFARVVAAKATRRHHLAALSFPVKVGLVVQLQRMAAPLLRARGRTVRTWDLPPTSPSTGRGNAGQ